MSLQAQAQAQRSARYSPQETIKVRENYIYVHFSFETGRLIFLFFFLRRYLIRRGIVDINIFRFHLAYFSSSSSLESTLLVSRVRIWKIRNV